MWSKLTQDLVNIEKEMLVLLVVGFCSSCLCFALPAAYSPAQTHALVKQQLSCPPGQRLAHHQLILQQATGGAANHRQLQPIALRVAPQETNSKPLPLSVKRLTTPSTQSQTNNESQAPCCCSSSASSSSVATAFASSAQASIPAATVQPQPPPLVAAPQRRTSFPQVQNQPPPPPPPLVLPRLPQNPPASLQRLSLHSVQALAVQSGRGLLTEQELPVAEALVQMPYQNLPPPQTVAVDLKVHPVRRDETPSVSCRVLCLSFISFVCSQYVCVISTAFAVVWISVGANVQSEWIELRGEERWLFCQSAERQDHSACHWAS